MLICGIKVTHDAAVAVLDGNRLLFSIEAEKLGNSQRHSSLGDLERVAQILSTEGIPPAEIDEFVVDGWFPPGGTITGQAAEPTVIPTLRHGQPYSITVAPYQDRAGQGDPIARYTFHDDPFGVPGQG